MKIQPFTGAITEDLMDLLLTADPDRAAVDAYTAEGLLLVALDGDDTVGVAVVLLQATDSELKNLAVRQSHQGRGIAKRLIAEAKRAARANGASSMSVGTGNSSLGQLALYQKCGFRMHHIIPDFFLSYPEPIFENGMQCLDMVVLKTAL
ncbi:MAG: GNAT family N-acetyltransferase [Halieaceae bacterium]|nr:GNAT family N-acetyltransferase [Halieaceae bacterium]